jgi:hypothetical protein
MKDLMTVHVNMKPKVVSVNYPSLNVTTCYNPITFTRSVITMNIMRSIVYNIKILRYLPPSACR